MSRRLPAYVLLDRDGVINRDSDGFILSPEEWRPIPGSLEAIAKLNRHGCRVAVITNQSGVARGLLNLETLGRIHGKMHRLVQAKGGRIDDVLFCPHDPGEGCGCRKPRPGLLLAFARRHRVSLAGIPVVGDSLRDLEAALAAGARPMLVETGKGRKTLADNPTLGVPHFKDLDEAAEYIISGR